MKNSKLLLSIALPVAGFVLSLLAASGYQYLRVKNDLVSPLVKTLQQAETRELHNFFTTIDQQLQLLREWGRQGVLFAGGAESFDKKMIPVLQQQGDVKGILLGNDKGEEYALYRDGMGYIARMTIAGKKLQRFRQWTTDGVKVKSWEASSEYDPSKRPWFQAARMDGSTSWTPVYTFFHSGQPGVTGVVGWEADGRRFVVGMDVGLSDFSGVLAETMAGRPGKLYLLDIDSGQFVMASSNDGTKDQKESNVEIGQILDTWKEQDRPEDEPFPMGSGKNRWLVSFHQLEAEQGGLWLALAVPESQLVAEAGPFRMGGLELFAGILGGLFTFYIYRLVASRDRIHQVSPDIRLLQLIDQGEGNRVEFKSTVRMNLKSGKVGKEIELAWLKTVVAFLNSEGGVLLLGVSDSGEILGVEPDNFENDDRCLLHIKNLVNQHVGAEFSGHIEPIPVTIDNRLVVMLECKKSKNPVFLNIGKNEEFYVRSGPSTMKLSPSQTVNYVRTSGGRR